MVEGLVGVKKLILLLTLLGFYGCKGASSSIAVSNEAPQVMPTTNVNPTLESSPTPSPTPTAASETPSANTPDKTTSAGSTEINDDPPEPALQNEDLVSEKQGSAPISGLIKNAISVMIHEGIKLGTACNAYVRRVLEVSGFSSADFLANDFEVF